MIKIRKWVKVGSKHDEISIAILTREPQKPSVTIVNLLISTILGKHSMNMNGWSHNAMNDPLTTTTPLHSGYWLTVRGTQLSTNHSGRWTRTRRASGTSFGVPRAFHVAVQAIIICSLFYILPSSSFQHAFCGQMLSPKTVRPLSPFSQDEFQYQNTTYTLLSRHWLFFSDVKAK